MRVKSKIKTKSGVEKSSGGISKPGKEKIKFLKIVKDRSKGQTEGNESGLVTIVKKRKKKAKAVARPYEGIPKIELDMTQEIYTQEDSKLKKIKKKNTQSVETGERKTSSKVDDNLESVQPGNEEESPNRNNEQTGAAKKGKNKKNKKKYVLFIGNLPYEIEEGEVKDHFKVVKDSIMRVTLLTDPTTGRGRGCGFIELTSPDAYQDALKLNLSKLGDHKIRVEFTVPGKKNSSKRNKFMKMKTKKILGQSKKGKKKRNKSQMPKQ